MVRLVKYTTTLGEVIEYPKPRPEVAAFLERVREAAEDPMVSENELITLAYGTENPILEQGRFVGRGAVTKEVFANPLYQVMQDLLQHKRLALGGTTTEQLFESFSLTVSEAAEQLSVTQAAVRKAILAGYLSAVKRPNGYLVDPRSVASYRGRVARRGPAKGADLRARVGNAPGMSFQLKVAGVHQVGRERKGDARSIDLEAPTFRRAAVVWHSKEEHLFLALERAVRVQRLEFGPFWIEGKFKIVERSESPQGGATLFKKFVAE